MKKKQGYKPDRSVMVQAHFKTSQRQLDGLDALSQILGVSKSQLHRDAVEYLLQHPTRFYYFPEQEEEK